MDVAFRIEDDTSPGDAPLAYELPRAGRVRLTVRAGERRTGGHSVEITHVTREGVRLTIQCAFHRPAADAYVTQALTAPARTVSVDERSVRGVRQAILVDESGAELARISA